MIRLNVLEPASGKYRYKFTDHSVSTDGHTACVREILIADLFTLRNRSTRRRWPGDSLVESTDEPHVPRDCRHRKLEASVEVRRGMGISTSSPDFDIFTFSDDIYELEGESYDLFPKDHNFILGLQDKRPLRFGTSYKARFPTRITRAAAADFVVLQDLTRDKYASTMPWRYWNIVHVLATSPVYIPYGRGKYSMGYVTYSASFRSRWEPEQPESWTSDESMFLTFPNSDYEWDFLGHEWVYGRFPYNRIFRSGLTSSDIRGIIKNPTFPGRFKVPDIRPPDPFKRIEGDGMARIVATSKAVLDNIAEDVVGGLNWLGARASHIPLPQSTHQKDLHLELIQNLHSFDSNLPLYFADLPKVGGTIQTMVESLRSRDVQSVASAWLSLRFADRLTWADTKELKSALETMLDRGTLLQHPKVKRSARDTVHTQVTYEGITYNVTERWNSTATFEAIISPETLSFDTIRRLCQEWDIISLENAWDAVPYSFVVDWLINVAGVLDIFDAGLQSSAYRISDIWDSVKRIVDIRPLTTMSPDFTIRYKSVSFVYYTRQKVERLKLPVFTRPLEPVGDGFYNWKHIVDTGMLIIQRF